MAVLYECKIENVTCMIVQQEDGSCYCQVDDVQYNLEHGFTKEEISTDFLMRCITGACYKKYAAQKILEGISFE